MPKDAPDFSVGTTDLLPSIVNTMPILRNYPGGSVFYFDNFEGPNITWDIDKADGASYGFAEIDKTHAYIGAGCARLYRNEDQIVHIRLDRRFQFRPSDTIGIEFSFMVSDIAVVRVELTYEYEIGGILYRFFITFIGDYITVSTPEGDYGYYCDPNYVFWNMVWSNIKVIINTKDHRYVRLYYGKDVFDIDHPAEVLPGGINKSPHLGLGCFFDNGGDVSKSLWIDKVILTDDEII